MIVVSSCLAGLPVRYNGTDSLHKEIRRLVSEEKALALCPELLGGFVTPREPAEIVGGDGYDVLDGRARVVEKSGQDVTAQYMAGAQRTLQIVQEVQAKAVILKENSPSCGSALIYDGQFRNRRLAGCGVTTALLRRHGIEVISEDEAADWLRGQGR
ncbi:DUF523 domain-containing protein [Alkalihalobacillus oceani]|uniref:DUF523 domain-containing protein n=1 Tax=Halalkalibacter oceani TaxID=1653776 RepID=UPI00203B0200|nr:DUF523 domain-containing protein [Halalkalibacter oceani]MCM3760640.1 DUF523 domain-containing protein [Halalkalibacter oceani]